MLGLWFATIGAVLSVTSCYMSSHQYTAVTSSGSGSVMCAVDRPTLSVVTRSPLKCAVECSTHVCCLTYQLNDELGQCQLYLYYVPTNYSTSPHCRAYRVSGQVVTDNSSMCSFPFTFGGQLYYTCAVDTSMTPCSVWCLNSAANRVECSSIDFVAQNVTVNVTIPPAMNSVPLMSVNGWLTIFSRLNSASFPFGLTYAAYQAGFGDIALNFWLGLERVYQLTNRAVNGGHGYRVRFELLATIDSRWYSEEYASFYLDSSATDYVLHVSATGTGDAGDALNAPLSPSNGMAFSVSYCTTMGPWWYTTSSLCSCCRVFGPEGVGGFSWSTNPPGPGNSRMGRIMIKRVD